MYHPLLLQPEVLRDLPALLEDRRPKFCETAAAPCYRSEAFAEDLPVEVALPVEPSRRLQHALLTLGPLVLVLVLASAGMAVFA
ncbi:MAG: hypothetical protein WAQ05_00060 [Rubrivivax sp.]